MRHIERTNILCYVVDVSKEENEALKDYMSLKRELQLYSPELISKPSIVIANKLDQNDSLEKFKKFYIDMKELGEKLPIFPISAIMSWRVEKVLAHLHSMIYNPNHFQKNELEISKSEKIDQFS